MSRTKNSFTPERLLDVLDRFPVSEVIWVAYSGGADSTALLQALHDLRGRMHGELRALHVNHGMHADADRWQAWCERFCHSRKIPFTARQVTIHRNSHGGIEAEARRQRYRVAQDVLQAGQVLCTAHHAQDQAETLLLNLMRGSGVDGLAGMPEIRTLGTGFLVRPLLSFSRDSLRRYLTAGDIEWIEDPSNLEESYDRNYVRQRLIPLLEQRWPHAARQIFRSARFCRESSRLLTRCSDQYLARCLVHPWVLDVKQLANDRTMFKLVVRHWLRHAQVAAMPTGRLEELVSQVRNAQPGHRIRIEWDGCNVQLYRHQLWLQADGVDAACPTRMWLEPGALELGPEVGCLELTPDPGELPGILKVRGRLGGERIRPVGSDHHRTVKRLFQEHGVPPWLRPAVPLLSLNDEIVALGDWLIARPLADWLEPRGARLRWRPVTPQLRLLRESCAAVAVDPRESLG